MSGNVREWCSDWYGSDYYQSSATTNPVGPSSGSYRVFRGGSCNNNAQDCRTLIRGGGYPYFSGDGLGVPVGPCSMVQEWLSGPYLLSKRK